MNKNEIISMLKLLEDPDDNVYKIIKDKIMNDSDVFKAYLENYHALSVNELAIERSESLLNDIFFSGFEKRLTDYFNKDSVRLLDGVLLVEEYFNRDIDITITLNETENLIKSIWIEFNEHLTGIEKVKLIGKSLFEIHGFKKFPIGNFKPEQLSFSNCISFKKFVAPNIALLYCVIADEFSIPLYPVALPGLFILSYVDKELANAVFEDKNNGSVFYIHPFDHGEFINHQIIEKYLMDKKIDKRLYDFGNMSYSEYLAFYFELRILALKHKYKKGFELDYADRVKNILKTNI